MHVARHRTRAGFSRLTLRLGTVIVTKGGRSGCRPSICRQGKRHNRTAPQANDPDPVARQRVGRSNCKADGSRPVATQVIRKPLQQGVRCRLRLGLSWCKRPRVSKDHRDAAISRRLEAQGAATAANADHRMIAFSMLYSRCAI